MANVTYDILWREAMMELLDQLEAENPENPTLAPKELSEWVCVYIRYLQIFRKLETAYDQMLQPQKRQDMKRALEACMGRMLEIRHWMVKLNRGLDFVQLDDLLIDLKLTPDVLEVPVPRYFIKDRAQELNDRDRFLQVLLEKYQQASAAQAGAAAAASDQPQQQQQQPSGALQAVAAAAAAGGGGCSQGKSSAQGLPVNAVSSGAPLLLEEAVAVIIRNERGRQARERACMLAATKRSRALAAQRIAAGQVVSKEDAARVIQSGIRGALWRRRVKREADQELVCVGMKPQPVDPQADPQVIEARHLLARKQQLLDPENGTLKRYEDAIVSLKAKVKETEGEDMREAIQDKINAWFITNRNPQTGDYPELPPQAAGGSKVILNPPLPTVEELIAANAAAAAAAGAKGATKGSGKGGSRPASGAAAGAAATGGKGRQPGPGKDGKKGAAAAGAAADSGTCEVATSTFIPLIEGAVAEYIAKWQERPAGRSTAQQIAHDPELLKDELRPLVFEEVRQQVDDEMRCLLANLKAMVAAEAAAKSGKPASGKKKGGGKKKKEGGSGGVKSGEKKAGESSGKKKGGGKKGGKKSKDPTADRSMESLFAELAANKVLGTLPRAELAEYLGGGCYMGATLEKAGLIPEPSMAQVRQAVAEFAILPLGSQVVHQRLPHIKSLLLYGAPHSGKTLLAHAIAHLSGACFFDLSPRNTDGCYPGKAVAMLLHLVFKVAKTMAPSVIYIDEVEKVFVSDKKKAREFGGQELFSRIRKDLLREIKALKPGDRVLVVGCSSQPWLVPKKDEAAFMSTWCKMLHLPLPDYAARRLIWPGLFARHGGRLTYDFDLSTLAHLTEGYAAGDLDAVVAGLMTPARRERLKMRPVDIPEVLQWLCRVQPVPAEADAALHAWRDKTPALAAIKGADGVSSDKGATAAAGSKKKASGQADASSSKGKKGSKK